MSLTKQVNGVTVTISPEEEVEFIEMWSKANPNKYKIDRQLEYPNIPDQLDAIWHAMDQGIIPKIEPMYTDCKSVKVKYPKPGS